MSNKTIQSCRLLKRTLNKLKEVCVSYTPHSRLLGGTRHGTHIPHQIISALIFVLQYRGPNIYLQISEGWVSGGWGQTLFSSAQRQDKGQWAQAEAEEVPAEHEEELLPSEGDGALEQAAHVVEVVESPSLEIFKTRLVKVLCSLL